jgi:hypothetical protein
VIEGDFQASNVCTITAEKAIEADREAVDRAMPEIERAISVL